MIRQPIITVLGHVDHGKTSILDAIRSSRVAAKEAGAITQHIGATEIPVDSIEKIAGPLLKQFGFDLKIPGLLVIDTPGHEAFTNLRKRGGSIADLAILVVDATQGLQPQTKEAIDILRANKVPFIIAMNKIDLLPFYNSKEGSFLSNLNSQNENVKRQMDEAIYSLIGKIYEHDFASERFDRCEFGKEVPIVPCSAHTKEGMPEILTLLSGLSQKYLSKNLEINEGEVAKGAVLEAKEEQGLGKTVDIILYKGNLKVNDEIALLGKNGIIKTKIRALLQPRPLQEMRETREKFRSVKEVFAAIGVKIAAPNLDEALVGSTLTKVESEDDIKELENEVRESTYSTENVGLIVKSDAIGSLEAIVALLKKEGYPVKKADVGNVSRKDVMEAAGILEKDKYLGTILAFGVDVEEEAIKEANMREVRIFKDKVIYKILEDYDEWVKKSKEEEKKAGLDALTYPAQIEVMNGKIFRNNKPAIFGASVVEGKLKEGVKVVNKNGEIIGKVSGIQNEGKSVKELKKGEEAAVAIGEAAFGKNIFEHDVLYSYITPNQFIELNKFIDEFSDEEKELIKKIREITKIEE
jgi:translation initiation factor 5B